jgi:hypothetical protein
MSRGSSTGDDDVFVLESDSGIVEPELLRIPVFATDFSKFNFIPNSKWRVIFPYHETPNGLELMTEQELEQQFPKGYRYLKSKKPKLLKRKGARFWYGFTAPRNLDLHDKAQIVVPLLAEKGSFATVPRSQHGKLCPMASGGFTIMLQDSSPVSADYVLGLLNSPILFWILLRTSNCFRGGWITCTKQYFGELPIRVLNRHDQKERSDHDAVVGLVQWLSWLHAQQNAEGARANPIDILMTRYFEQWVNALVYELYFPTELHASSLHFFDLIQAEELPQLDKLAESDRLPRLRNLFIITYAPDNKLRQALYRLGSLDLIRTIEGKA